MHTEQTKTRFPALKAKFTNTFFAQENTFKGNVKKKNKFTTYTHILSVNEGNTYDAGNGLGIFNSFNGYSFANKPKEIVIEKLYGAPIHAMGDQISKEDFMEALNKLRANIKNLN